MCAGCVCVCDLVCLKICVHVHYVIISHFIVCHNVADIVESPPQMNLIHAVGGTYVRCVLSSDDKCVSVCVA